MKIILLLLLFFLPTIMVSLMVISSAIWVYKDAKKFQQAGIKMMKPGNWSVWVLLLWLPFFPLYIILRFLKYKKQFLDPTFRPNTFVVSLITVLIVVLGIGGVLFLAIKDEIAKQKQQEDFNKRLNEQIIKKFEKQATQTPQPINN